MMKKKTRGRTTEANSDDDDDDDENDEDYELLLWYGWLTKGVEPYFEPRPLSEILTITNLCHAGLFEWRCTVVITATWIG